MELSRMKESSMTTRAATSYCGCSFCTQAVWDTVVTDGGGSYSCGSRIKWLQSAQGYSEAAACAKIAAEFQGTCTCNPTSCSGPKVLAPPDPSTLVWSDEFNVDGPPDPRKWGYDIGDGCSIGLCGWGNNKNEYYTQSSSNVIISNGILRITARKQSGFSQPYTSAKLKTRDLRLFKYGQIQFCASMAKCKARGTWPALWMVGFTISQFCFAHLIF
jgi:beta-glucanase (GH16 family)